MTPALSSIRKNAAMLLEDNPLAQHTATEAHITCEWVDKPAVKIQPLDELST